MLKISIYCDGGASSMLLTKFHCNRPTDSGEYFLKDFNQIYRPGDYLSHVTKAICIIFISVVTADNLTHSLHVYIQSLTTASGLRLFGSVVDHWIIDPTARVRFPSKSWEFFHPNLL